MEGKKVTISRKLLSYLIIENINITALIYDKIRQRKAYKII
jgi:hypothetical protein